MSVNNGARGTVRVNDQDFVAGIVEHEHHTEISYPAPTDPRPVVGGYVTLDGQERLVLSVEASLYVRGFIVVKVENAKEAA